ncbi:uncharacterized protein TNCV_3218201 [Trichonephila clavipes]|nr:uncharacterized protein TNCV_3218201 [Trichonephila clavipes]
MVKIKLRVFQSYKESDIVNFIKIQRIKWAGHVIRMKEDRTAKKVFNAQPIGTRRKGMCARVRATYANFPPFLADQRASRKMATSKRKAFCVIQFAKTESAITVVRAFRIFGCQPPNDNILRE